MFGQDECWPALGMDQHPALVWARPKRSSSGQDWSVLVSFRPNMIQQGALAAMQALLVKVTSIDKGRNLFPLHNTCQTSPGELPPVLGPQCRKDIHKLQGAQGSVPKAVGLEHLPQEERLGSWCWVSLEDGRLWGHLTATLHTAILLTNVLFNNHTAIFIVIFIFSLVFNYLLFGFTIQ